MALKAIVKTTVEKKLEEYEGRYNHMYLDSKGKVTVGVGHLIPNKIAVAVITLYKTKKNIASTPATVNEKQDEYDTVAKQKKNYKASWYKQYTTLIMKDADINALRNKHIDSFYKELSGLYKKSNGYATDFDNMPQEVQKALFDMVFNLGITKLSMVFTQFNNAIKNEQWDEAAKQSNRPDVSAARNGYVKNLFNLAHTKSKTTSKNP